MKRTVFLFSSLALLMGTGYAATGSVIGVAVSEGSLSVDNSSVSGNANLADGATVRTDAAPGRLQLYKGQKVVVGDHSQVKVYGDRLVLDKGTTQIAGSPNYSLEALGMRVAPSNNAQAVVKIENSKLLVAALNGPVSVSNAAGVPLASVVSGRSLSFQPTSKTDATSTMRGTVAKENGHFYLPDEMSGLKVELTGKGLENEVGRRISVTGSATPSSDRSTQVIEVAKLNRLAEASPEPEPSPSPSPAPQTPRTGVPGAGGVSGLTVGVIVGLVAAGTFGAIYGIKYGTNQPTGGISR